jgi:hypothetical protein
VPDSSGVMIDDHSRRGRGQCHGREMGLFVLTSERILFRSRRSTPGVRFAALASKRPPKPTRPLTELHFALLTRTSR